MTGLPSGQMFLKDGLDHMGVEAVKEDKRQPKMGEVGSWDWEMGSQELP